MVERIKALREKAKSFEEILTDKEQTLIYFKSVQNFLLYIDQFNDPNEKLVVLEKIELYLLQLEENNFSFNINEKREILNNFIKPIAFYYKLRFGFRFEIGLKYSIFIGINIDVILLIFGLLKHLYFIPITTLILFSYWLFIKIGYSNKSKVY